mmetsp:Transcript_26351/g.39922  ORF Transcript_26351/g.39922 Transcript_26351/m.39922 type:complete len:229 (+) Transcript_26351:32-718(+)
MADESDNDTRTPTKSVIKANILLASRREKRRDLDQAFTRVLHQKLHFIGKESLKDITCLSHSSNFLLRQDQVKKAYSRLTHRRSRRSQQDQQEITDRGNYAATNVITMSGAKRLIVLLSNGVSDRVQSANQGRALMLLQAKKVPFVEVDGMDVAQKERRDELFKISNIRGNYPQFFLEDENGEISYVGDWEYVEGLNESSSLPEETLQANPQIKTWESIFGNLVHSFN